MAVDPIAENPNLQDALRLGGDDFTEEASQESGPLYRVIGDNKIPVSKATGKLWAGRIDQSRAARADVEDCWNEAIRYYENDQTGHRKGGMSNSGSNRFTRNISDQWAETENVVFSNATLMLPMLYAKNPAIETTAFNDVNAAFASTCEHLVNKLLLMKDAPGLNFKTKARRGVLMALLTNNAYLKLDFTRKNDSNEAAVEELRGLSKELENAKDQKTIREVEGKIQAIEDKISFLTPSGPKVSIKSPFRIYVDPTSEEPDLSDANWVAEYDFLPTAYLRAVYGIKDGEQYKSAYEPTHIMRAGANQDGSTEDDATFTLFNKDETNGGRHYGYKTAAAYAAAQYTKVWYIWDKTTRRVLLYSDGCWEWPLWVWDDPYKLLRFYPYFRLWFHETPEGSQPKGEVTYYLDQQDSINEIHSEVKRMRNWAKNNVYYNKNAISQDDATAVLTGPDGTARGVDVPEGQKLEDHVKTFSPPSLQHPELWNTDRQFQTINRITGINDAQRGAQFKTNTTNDAIKAYQQNVDIRVDEKIDAIEDWIGDFAWALIQLLTMNYTKDDVAKILGDFDAQNWKEVSDPSELRTTLQMQVVGGSTDKPTSKVKKRQALEVCQVLGQVGNSVPGVAIMMLRVLSRAFDEIVITDKDWAMLFKSMEDAQNKAGAGPGGAQGGQGQEQQQPQEAEPTPEQKEQLAQVIRSLPPESKAKMDALIQQGVSPTEALKQVAQTAQQPQ